MAIIFMLMGIGVLASGITMLTGVAAHAYITWGIGLLVIAFIGLMEGV